MGDVGIIRNTFTIPINAIKKYQKEASDPSYPGDDALFEAECYDIPSFAGDVFITNALNNAQKQLLMKLNQ
jgi:hypothetical protein